MAASRDESFAATACSKAFFAPTGSPDARRATPRMYQVLASVSGFALACVRQVAAALGLPATSAEMPRRRTTCGDVGIRARDASMEMGSVKPSARPTSSRMGAVSCPVAAVFRAIAAAFTKSPIRRDKVSWLARIAVSCVLAAISTASACSGSPRVSQACAIRRVHSVSVVGSQVAASAARAWDVWPASKSSAAVLTPDVVCCCLEGGFVQPISGARPPRMLKLIATRKPTRRCRVGCVSRIGTMDNLRCSK